MFAGQKKGNDKECFQASRRWQSVYQVLTASPLSSSMYLDQDCSLWRCLYSLLWIALVLTAQPGQLLCIVAHVLKSQPGQHHSFALQIALYTRFTSACVILSGFFSPQTLNKHLNLSCCTPLVPFITAGMLDVTP